MRQKCKKCLVSTVSLLLHRNACKLWYSEGKHGNMPHMWECLWISGTFVCFFQWEHFSCSIPTGKTGIVTLKTINSLPRSICCFRQILFLQMRTKLPCLVIHAGRWYWSCQILAEKWGHSSVLANHGDRQWAFKNSMSFIFCICSAMSHNDILSYSFSMLGILKFVWILARYGSCSFWHAIHN